MLNALNTRLDADAIPFMLDHGEARTIITDREFSATITAALEKAAAKPIVIDVDDPDYAGPGERLGRLDYEALLGEGDPDYTWQPPTDEWQAISLDYTSGTTGNPKGVVYSHREHAAAGGLPVAAADVPLQRLVLPVEHGRQRRPPRHVGNEHRRSGDAPRAHQGRCAALTNSASSLLKRPGASQNGAWPVQS